MKVKREEQSRIEELKHQMKIDRAAADICDLELKHGNIKSACSYIMSLMHHGNAAQLLSTKKNVGKRFEQLITKGSKLQTNRDEAVVKQSTEFSVNVILGYLVSDVDISKCTNENIPKRLLKGDSADLLITTRDSTGNEVFPKQQLKAKVRKSDGACEEMSASCDMNGTYEVTIYGQMGGKYEITITLGDVPLGCPVIIPVIKVLVMTIGCEGTSWGQYRNPCAVAMNVDNDIVCVDRSNKGYKSSQKRAYDEDGLDYPNGVALTDDVPCRVVVADRDNHCIKVFVQ
ncbi:E3 ubiquitin-protein ligase TRIM71-like [Ptychodera flava]|uniref:E3 ubiquitin-protein ligase TRIM71-like n=1 Tax=Ptychodera flava TaxID=63121 RepID=UPI00396A8D5A